MWTDEIVEKLKKHHLGGRHSMSIVAGMLNKEFGTSFSRNAVIGKVSRLGLQLPKRTSDFFKARKTSGPRKPTNINTHFPKSQLAPDVEVIAMASIFKSLDLSRPKQRITVEQIETGQCRYIYGHPSFENDWTFCGRERVAGQSYCVGHHHMTHTQRFALQKKPAMSEQLEAV